MVVENLKIAALIVGICGSIFLITAYIPQVIKVIKTKRSDSISFLFLYIVTIACFLFVIYACINLAFNTKKALGTAVPLLIANFIVGCLTIVILIYKTKNYNKAKKLNMSETQYFQQYICKDNKDKEVSS